MLATIIVLVDLDMLGELREIEIKMQKASVSRANLEK